MAQNWFRFGKKKEETKTGCCCQDQPAENTSCCCSGAASNADCTIKVLGSGCKNCRDLFENTQAAVKNMGIDAQVEYVTDMQKVMEYGAMSMPALVADEKVVSQGRVLKAPDVEKLLHKLGF